MISPATTTASTPETWTFSASRYAPNGVASDTALAVSGSPPSGRDSTRTPKATTAPTATPPAAATRNWPNADGTEKPSPVAAAMATARMVSAVASLSRPSPCTMVVSRGGSPALRPTASAATGSGGATAAPSAMPAARVAPVTNHWKPTPITSAVSSTRTTERLTTIRRLRRIAISDESSAAL